MTAAQRPPSRSPRPKTARQRELTSKRRGEIAELAFTHKAVSLGFAVSKPYGDSQRYDFILDSGTALYRVQIKSSSALINGFYHVNADRRTGRGKVPYLPSEIDFLIAYVIPDDTWFILPIDVVSGHSSLFFNPRNHYRSGLSSPYREAWDLLRHPRKCSSCGHAVPTRSCGSDTGCRSALVPQTNSKTLTEKQRREIAALRQLGDDSIDTSDIPEIKDWSGAVVGKFYRPLKEAVSIRLDVDVLAWLKSKGPGYQTRLNRLLRELMMKDRRRGPGKRGGQ